MSYIWKHDSGTAWFWPICWALELFPQNRCHLFSESLLCCPLPSQQRAWLLSTVTPDSVTVGGDCHQSWRESRRERFQMSMKTVGICQAALTHRAHSFYFFTGLKKWHCLQPIKKKYWPYQITNLSRHSCRVSEEWERKDHRGADAGLDSNPHWNRLTPLKF